MSVIDDKESLSCVLEPWLVELSQSEPIARWVSKGPEILGINYDGDFEIRAHKIGTHYLVVKHGCGLDSEIVRVDSMLELSEHMKRESKRGNPEDGWKFYVRNFNNLIDMYPAVPEEVRAKYTPTDLIDLLAIWDDELTSMLFYGENA